MRSYLNFVRGELPLLGYGLSFTFLSSFGQTFLVSLFVPAFLVEFAIGNGTFGALYAGATLASACLLPWVGGWMDRVRLTRFTVAVVLLLSASAFLLAASRTLWMFAAALVGLRLAGQGLSGQTALTAMARYFGPGRGRALSITSLGFPAGEALLPLLITASIALIGWRGSWVVVGASTLVVFAPIMVALLRQAGVELHPSRAEPKDLPESGFGEDDAGALVDPAREGGDAEEVGDREADKVRDREAKEAEDPGPEGAEDREAGWGRRQVFGDPIFWLALPAALLPPFWVTGFFLYQTQIASIKGWSIALMASAFIAFAATRVVMSLAAGTWVDRFSARRVFPFSPIPIAIGFLALWSSDAVWAAYLFMGFVGVATGMSGTVKSALWAELYGIRNLGSIQTMMAALMVLSTAGSPLVMGYALDAGVSLETLLLVGVGTVVAGTVLAIPVAGAKRRGARTRSAGRG